MDQNHNTERARERGSEGALSYFQNGIAADSLMNNRFQWINVWKPLRGPVNDWPLCFCDPLTVDPVDIEVTDMVYPEYFTENQSLRYSRDQKWYYLSDHRPEEIVVFKQSDSDPTAAGGVPHFKARETSNGLLQYVSLSCIETLKDQCHEGNRISGVVQVLDQPDFNKSVAQSANAVRLAL